MWTLWQAEACQISLFQESKIKVQVSTVVNDASGAFSAGQSSTVGVSLLDNGSGPALAKYKMVSIKRAACN